MSRRAAVVRLLRIVLRSNTLSIRVNNFVIVAGSASAFVYVISIALWINRNAIPVREIHTDSTQLALAFVVAV